MFRFRRSTNGKDGLLRPAALLAGCAVLCGLTGCTVREHNNGEAENVQIHTPVGALDVRTNAVQAIDTGLPVYPGAVESGRHGDDSGSADVHMSFGKWRLNVKAIEYTSTDPEKKLVTFYKNAMSRYGDVLTCKDKAAIGQPQKTSQGLTCSNDHEYDVNLKLDTSKKSASVQMANITGDVKLLAGSPDDQHIVEFTPVSNGTKFSLVAVQLPQKDHTD